MDARTAPPLRILLIEDCLDDAELLALELVEAQLQAVWTRVEDEQQLQAALAAAGHDLVVSDLSLPGFCGLRALQLVREVLPQLPFIFLSGDSRQVGVDTAMPAGASGSLSKHDIARMPEMIRQALGID